MAALSYADVKDAMSAQGLPVAAGAGWEPQDIESYFLFIRNCAYKAGVPADDAAANYGFSYPSVMPTPIVAAVTAANYSATLAGTPLTGTAGTTSITFTLTETGGAGTSFFWEFGDGTTKTSANKVEAHTYAAAGSYTAKCTPTVNGVALAPISAAAPVVIS